MNKFESSLFEILADYDDGVSTQKTMARIVKLHHIDALERFKKRYEMVCPHCAEKVIVIPEYILARENEEIPDDEYELMKEIIEERKG